ncbi:uncharacterized protein LOC128740922 [Sabethes cyaneus]|uniref:uncharacterized protein LOC128740922 n=1 Tax=Sabethes cyaneus TaxID=53552 RepID=UPI00237D6397|nr:uncharacterized protein LOC128740922 [Sabethes cyaneus]
MKCIAAVVMMALAVVAEAGYAPLLYNIPYDLVPQTTFIQGNLAKLVKISELPVLDAASGYPYSNPLFDTLGVPGPYLSPTVLLQKEARYLAANRGAIHEAPLPGHELSQHQLNLDPAAGAL